MKRFVEWSFNLHKDSPLCRIIWKLPGSMSNSTGSCFNTVTLESSRVHFVAPPAVSNNQIVKLTGEFGNCLIRASSIRCPALCTLIPSAGLLTHKFAYIASQNWGRSLYPKCIILWLTALCAFDSETRVVRHKKGSCGRSIDEIIVV